MEVGQLVKCDNGLGTGKVVARDGDTATVEYFESVAVRERREVPVVCLRRVHLAPETRCYFTEQDGETWRAGRIGQCWGGQYEVKLPDREGRYMPEGELFARCAKPIGDPMEVLIHRAHETAFFAQRRLPFVRSLIEQRGATRGHSGLFSSRIDLYPHQVEVVRRVLEDPIQRYLLADEVGLGKTIETGAILRQFLLDSSSGRALVLVPSHLREQWLSELRDKFGIDDFPGRVEVKELSAVENVDSDLQFAFVAVDEAHHIAGFTETDSSKWRSLQSIAHAAERLLLLSATPALHNEDAFLAMLHLLDPDLYSLDDLEGFRRRVRNRQDMGRFLLSFNEGASGFILKRGIARLRNLVPEDESLLESVRQLERMVEGEAEEVDQHIRRIRTQVAEKYRLHRRLLRNRRSAVDQSLTAGRGDSERDVVEEYDLDGRSERLHVLLDEWRIAAAETNVEGSRQADLQRIFELLLESAGTWLGVLEAVVRGRRGAETPEELRTVLPPADLRVLRETPPFAEEETILDAILEVLEEHSDEGDRIDLLRMILQPLRRPRGGGPSQKTVVFTSYGMTRTVIVERLAKAFGATAVAEYAQNLESDVVEGEVRRFREDQRCAVLVCDRSGEEGRNLQFADWLIHFDVPLDPNRLEQRIGRLDRMGRVKKLRSRVLLGPESETSFSSAWFKMLRDGFRVFDESIASLQFYVESTAQRLRSVLFKDGAEGVTGLLSKVREEIDEEQVRLAEQYALDEMAAREDDAQVFLRQLERFDEEHEWLKGAAEDWICGALGFDRRSPPERPSMVEYHSRTRGRPTLVPHDFLATRVDDHLGRRGTYRRRVAVQYPNVTLYRVGDPFIDAMARYIEWDDRGRASAVWRVDDGWSREEGEEWTGFRFHYVVETDIGGAEEVLGRRACGTADLETIRRRADGLLAPSMATIVVDGDGTVVDSRRLLSILERPYRARRDFGNDYNLRKHRVEALDRVIDPGVWQRVCDTARTASETVLREDRRYRNAWEERARKAERQLEQRLELLRLRCNDAVPSETNEVEFEEELGRALVSGIREPRIRLDAVMFFIVSGRNPFEFETSGF